MVVGNDVGAKVGEVVGNGVGLKDGDAVGFCVVGAAVGACVGYDVQVLHRPRQMLPNSAHESDSHPGGSAWPLQPCVGAGVVGADVQPHFAGH